FCLVLSGLNDGALAATGAPFYFTQKTARNERFLVISCGFLLWTYVTVPFSFHSKELSLFFESCDSYNTNSILQ
ncbi:hypothetical protein, partial [Enterococcus casseliflavus]|uniref:hypothetical protein n=1 Tax=Enterococcus casseliflavus TaxID=37734 RepID=UPI001E517411